MSRLIVFLGGERVTLAERPLKVGGQAAVYLVPDRDGLVVKVYQGDPDEDHEHRVERMVRLSPLARQEIHASQPPELAWPTVIGRDGDGRFVGYAMRRFGEPEYVQLIALFSRRTRFRYFQERVDWKFLLGVALNLAFMTDRLHDEDLVIGDFSSKNVVVDRGGFVTFLDCDSIAFTDPDTGEHFPCMMLTPEYGAPERHRGGLATFETDDFALAILIYQLLTGGNHPFGVPPRDGGPESTVTDNIVSSNSYVVRPEAFTMPPNVIDPTVLPPALLDLAHTAFGPGVDDPSARPKATDWVDALDDEWKRLRTCGARQRHTYGSHLTSCPWCERAIASPDMFNDVPAPPRTPRIVPDRPLDPVPAPHTHRPPTPTPTPPPAGLNQVVVGATLIVFAIVGIIALILAVVADR